VGVDTISRAGDVVRHGTFLLEDNLAVFSHDYPGLTEVVNQLNAIGHPGSYRPGHHR
jgi:hypothetical protein